VSDDLAARVARGMAVLDERMPGWDALIDLDLLDLDEGVHDPQESECGCVLAQLDYDRHVLRGDTQRMPSPYRHFEGEGTYNCGLWHLTGLNAEVLAPQSREASAWAREHGFLDDSLDGDGGELTQAWRDAITTRRAAP